MKVLFLGPIPSSVIDILFEYGCEVIVQQDPISVAFLERHKIEYAVSYRYRYMVKKPIIDYLKGRIINLHISLLPWNRGADPNLWSFLDDTPKGASIHLIDSGLDTGEILIKKEINFNLDETLRSTYERLTRTVEDLFRQSWPEIVQGNLRAYPQTGGGTYHRTSDKERFLPLLVNGWDTPIRKIIGRGKVKEL